MWLLTNFESPQYTPVIKQCPLAHLKTTLNDEKFFLLAVKKIKVLKNSFNFWLRPLKKTVLERIIMLFSLTDVDVCRVTKQYLFKINFFAFKQGFLLGRHISITIFVSSYRHFSAANTSCSKLCHSITLNQYYAQVLCDQKRACNVLFSKFPTRTPESKQFLVV